MVERSFCKTLVVGSSPMVGIERGALNLQTIKLVRSRIHADFKLRGRFGFDRRFKKSNSRGLAA